MCLTLGNAAAVLDHHHGTSRARGYTATRHHAGHLTPGDWWRPDPDDDATDGAGGRPRTVTEIHRHHGVLTVTDQYGQLYTYPADQVLPTAVPDPLDRPPHDSAGTVHRRGRVAGRPSAPR